VIHLYGARNLVERFFNRIKHCRQVATRHDKLAANYLAFVQLASIRLWPHFNESTTCYSAVLSFHEFEDRRQVEARSIRGIAFQAGWGLRH
jgi:hypothetical protein